MNLSPFKADNSPESPSAILLLEIFTFFAGSVHVTTRSLRLLGGVMYLNMRRNGSTQNLDNIKTYCLHYIIDLYWPLHLHLKVIVIIKVNVSDKNSSKMNIALESYICDAIKMWWIIQWCNLNKKSLCKWCVVTWMNVRRHRQQEVKEMVLHWISGGKFSDKKT